jgi:Histone acetyltransferase
METRHLSSYPQGSVKFSLGTRNGQPYRIVPFFFPFMGCEERCIFCAQHRQSGAVPLQESEVLEQVKTRLADIPSGELAEIAFYGGSFTLWSRSVQHACLEAVAALGHSRVRCSTRPAAFSGRGEARDPLDPAWLEHLYGLGMRCIELGIQSFDDAALRNARRGYAGSDALRGCGVVLTAGMHLGVQLMPGMPGVTPAVFLRDVATALGAGARFVRFYPCLVIEGTPLAALWRAGRFTPWDLETTVDTLAEALVMCWDADVPVIRMGLAPGEDLANSVLAGPWHPSLGSLVQAEALGVQVARHMQGRERAALALPRRCQGFAGDKRAGLRRRWRQLGISSEQVTWHDGREGVLHFA